MSILHDDNQIQVLEAKNNNKVPISETENKVDCKNNMCKTTESIRNKCECDCQLVSQLLKYYDRERWLLQILKHESLN